MTSIRAFIFELYLNFHLAKMRVMRFLSALFHPKIRFLRVTLPGKLTRFTPLKRGRNRVRFWFESSEYYFFRIISAHNARFLFLFTLELRWVK